MPEDDDQDIELEGDYFVSGVDEWSPYTNPLEDIKTVRHGVESICISDNVSPHLLYHYYRTKLMMVLTGNRIRGRSSVPSHMLRNIQRSLQDAPR